MANGNPVILGQDNDETKRIVIVRMDGSIKGGFPYFQHTDVAIYCIGDTALMGLGSSKGVEGEALLTNDAGTVGVHGSARDGIGVQGVSNGFGDDGLGNPIPGGNGRGVVGQATDAGIGVAGYSEKGIGIIGRTNASRTGVVGSSQSGVGVYGTSSPGAALFLGSAPPDIGVLGFSQSGTGIFGSSTGHAGLFDGPVLIVGSLTVTGSKSAAVPHPDGSHRQLYCVESPESWFEDFGEAQLKGERAEVQLDPDFAALIDTSNYQVFLTSYDPVNLYVQNRRPEGFDVHVIAGNRGQKKESSKEISTRFGYRIVARRKDIEARRLEKVEIPQPLRQEEGINLNKIPEPPTIPQTADYSLKP